MSPTCLEEVVSLLDQAAEERHVVRETRVEATDRFLATRRPALMVVVIGDQTSSFPVFVGRLCNGDYLLPWSSESITEEMTNGLTHLVLDDQKIFFCDVRELFYGDTKAFIACTPGAATQDG